MPRQTYFAKAGDITPTWRHVDAAGQVLGRLSTRIATVLMGKHRPEYTPHVDCGDYVIVTNAEKVLLTGRKREQKMKLRYSGYPGGLKSESYGSLLERRPDQGRMAGMWQLPTREASSSGLFPAGWPRGTRVELGADFGGLGHGITHHRIRARLRAARVSGDLPPSWSWVARARLGGLALTGMTRKALRNLQPCAPPADLSAADTLPRPTPGAERSPRPTKPRSAPRA